jgi:hypothetical protein
MTFVQTLLSLLKPAVETLLTPSSVYSLGSRSSSPSLGWPGGGEATIDPSSSGR